MVCEILGLPASGKSTIKKSLVLKYGDFHFDFEDENKKKGLYLINKIPVSIYIWYTTKDITFVKGYLYLQVLLKAFDNYVNDNRKLIFDQGAIYLVCMLIKEIPSLESYFLSDLKKVLVHYDKIVYLEASSDILSQRINAREKEHRVKNSDAKVQLEFLEEYMIIYQKILSICYQEGVSITNIDTGKNNIAIVESLIVEIIEK